MFPLCFLLVSRPLQLASHAMHQLNYPHILTTHMAVASTNKYDRQLRLWGRNGQKALVESKLLLLGASCTGKIFLLGMTPLATCHVFFLTPPFHPPPCPTPPCCPTTRKRDLKKPRAAGVWVHHHCRRCGRRRSRSFVQFFYSRARHWTSFVGSGERIDV